MENNLSRLIGLSIQIRRSDGRVQFALVRKVNAVTQTAMVEWTQGNMVKMKEVEINDLCKLNPELVYHMNSVTTSSTEAPPLIKGKYDGRLRSSRIPALASSMIGTTEESVSSHSLARQTCLFQPPAVPIRESATPKQTSHPDPCSSAAITDTVGLHFETLNQQCRKPDEPLQSLPFNYESVKKNGEPEVMPPPPIPKAGRRKSVAPPEMMKSKKRQSSAIKPPDNQTKMAKLGEVSRPNQKFYEMIQEFRETLEVRPVLANQMNEPHRISVCVRKRPLNKQELIKKEIDVVTVSGKGELMVHEPKQKVDLTKYLDNQVFHFDYSFDESSTNELVYKFTAKPLVQSVFEGGMATCFAYGQTGSGKTHTMGGDFNGKQQNNARGIYALAAQDVFASLNHSRYSNLDVSVYVSFFEIYNGKVYDLLNKKAKLRVLEDDKQQVQVVGLEESHVTKAEEVIKIIQIGSAYRTSGQTSANAKSSRSHAVLQIILRRNDWVTTLYGKFSLVDLAGNERGTDVSSNDRNTLVETAEINRSLLALKECIRSMGMNSDHIPFRMSTLTKVLRDSFIGEKSRTCMIALVAPGMTSCAYTMNTLRYADRVKELKGDSKARGTDKAQEPAQSLSEEESMESSDGAISQVAELEEKVHAQLKRGSDFVKAMDQISYSTLKGLPDLLDHAHKLLDAVLALQAAVDQET
ncbi:kinesin-like protein KIF2C isoform X2 [Gouania willdenowi]|uniref:Kinesin-like protein n=1 Tax=Gouania willdenowi TaxID=441366 RepID=A0A8C5H032_GOUWI|nr:kinesin-like protein KIF2C isoform X2 [Gouania willdenowi]